MPHRGVLHPETRWTALALLMAVAAAIAGQKLLEAGWRAADGTEPPLSPATKDATWAESLTWGVVTGAILGVLSVLSRQAVRTAQRRWS